MREKEILKKDIEIRENRRKALWWLIGIGTTYFILHEIDQDQKRETLEQRFEQFTADQRRVNRWIFDRLGETRR